VAPAEPLYDAFISYRHSSRQRAIAVALQHALHRFAKPFWALRAVRLFRDETNLAANPDLYSVIEASLDSSRFLLLMASPEAADSKWVGKEVSHWLDSRGSENLIIVLTDGQIHWNADIRRFDAAQTDALPAALMNSLTAEPLYIDLTWAQHPANDFTADNVKFADAVASISARIRGVPKDEIAGEDVRRRRQLRRTVLTTGLVLLALLAGLGVAILLAYSQGQVAALQERIGESQRLLAQAVELQRAEPGGLTDAVARAIVAHRLYPSELSESVLRRATVLLPDPLALTRLETAFALEAIAISADGKVVAGIGSSGAARRWTIDGKELDSTPLPEGADQFIADPSGRVIVVRDAQGRTFSWEPDQAPAFSDAQRWSRPIGEIRALSWGGQFALTVADQRLLSIENLNTSGAAAKVPIDSDASTLAASAITPDGRLAAWSFNTRPSNGPALIHLAGAAMPPAVMTTPEILSGLSFDPSGTRLAAGDVTVLRIWSIAERAVESQIDLSTKGASMLAWSPLGDMLAVSGGRDSASVFDLMTRREAIRVVQPQSIRALVYSERGDRLVTVSGVLETEKNAVLPDLATWRIDQVSTLRRRALGNVTAMTFSANEIALLESPSIALWDAEMVAKRFEFVPDPGNYPSAIAFRSDARALLVATQERPLLETESQDPGQVRALGEPLPATVNASAFNPESSLLAWYFAGTSEWGIRIVDTADGSVVRTVPIDVWFHGMSWQSNAPLLAYCEQTEREKSWRTVVIDARSGSTIFEKTSAVRVSNPRFVPGTTRLVLYEDRDLVMLDISTGHELMRRAMGEYVEAIEIDAEGRNLAVATNDNFVRILDVGTFATLAALPIEADRNSSMRVRLLKFAPDGASVFATLADEPWSWVWQWSVENLMTTACGRVPPRKIGEILDQLASTDIRVEACGQSSR